MGRQSFFLKLPGRGLRAVATGLSNHPVTGIVICHALADERYHSNAQVLSFIDHCESRGIAALYPDLFACGQSQGDFRDATARGWIEDLKAACAFLRDGCGVTHIYLLGVRYGATLALRLAGEEPGTEGAILWEPVTMLRRHLRLMSLGSRIVEVRDSDETGAVRVPARADGCPADEAPNGYTVGAYAFSNEMLRQLTEMSKYASGPQRIPLFVISIGRTGVSSFVLEFLKQQRNGDVEHVQHRFLSFWESISYTPSEELNGITLDWIQRRERVVPRTDDGGGRRTPTAGQGAEEFSLAVGAERILDMGDDSVGTLHVPDQGMSRAKGAVLINTGGRGDSTGPGRLLVRAARCFARRGYLVYRFDTPADTPETEGREVYRSFVDLMFSLRALRAFATVSGTSRFSLVSLCRGMESVFLLLELSSRALIPFRFSNIAFWSPQPMVGDIKRVRRMRAFNERLRQYMRKLGYWETWQRALRGQLHVQGIVSALRGPRRGDTPRDLSRSQQMIAEVDQAGLRQTVADITASPPRVLTHYRGNVLMVAPEFDTLGLEGIDYYRELLSGKPIDVQTRVLVGARHNYTSPVYSEELFRITADWLDGVAGTDEATLLDGIDAV